jgi:hypothetical protein
MIRVLSKLLDQFLGRRGGGKRTARKALAGVLLYWVLGGISTSAQELPAESSEREEGSESQVLADAIPLPSSYSTSTSTSLPIRTDTFIKPIERVSSASQQNTNVNWRGLTKGTFAFLAVMHGFRFATEPATRQAIAENHLFKGYFNAVGNLHGFSDGDPFYVNYIGHPMQGAVCGFIWANNDNAYKDVYFGRDRRYWKEKLRGGAYSYLFSVQFEIGPLSEASIGNIQSYYPAFGFVDHVITPTVGLGWEIGEDAIDRYVVRGIERRTDNRYIRLLARGLLNPSRSFANMMDGKLPWYRTNRPAAGLENSATYYRNLERRQQTETPSGVPPFEFNVFSEVKSYLGSSGICPGGGATAALRIAEAWQIVADVNGCMLTGLPENVSGDSLTYEIGPRWTGQLSPRVTTHAQVLVGGNKVTEELVDPVQRALVDQQRKLLAEKGMELWPIPYSEFAKTWDNNAFSVTTGGGVDLKLNNALRLRTGFGYSRTWNQDINGNSYRHSLHLSSGLVLNMGTW